MLGVLLPNEQVLHTDVWTFLKLMIMIEHIKIVKMMQIPYLDIWSMAYSRKKPKQGRGLKIYFSEPTPPPGIFRFVTLPLEVTEKTSFHSRKFCKIVWQPLEIPRSKTKTHGNFIWAFLEHSWSFHFYFNWCFFLDKCLIWYAQFK